MLFSYDVQNEKVSVTPPPYPPNANPNMQWVGETAPSTGRVGRGRNPNDALGRGEDPRVSRDRNLMGREGQTVNIASDTGG